MISIWAGSPALVKKQEQVSGVLGGLIHEVKTRIESKRVLMDGKKN